MAAAKATTVEEVVQKYSNEFTEATFKTIKFESMVKFINDLPEKEQKRAKEDFKDAAYKKADGTASTRKTKDGTVEFKYNHINAKKWFFETYYPNCIPKAKEKTANPTDILNNW